MPSATGVNICACDRSGGTIGSAIASVIVNIPATEIDWLLRRSTFSEALTTEM